MNLGDTFLGGGEIHGEHHLWIVINDPSLHNGMALIVNVSTLREGSDTTCVLKAGDHPFIRHDSYIRFGSARGPKSTDLDELVAKRRFTLQQPASKELIEKIRAGATASAQIPSALRKLL